MLFNRFSERSDEELMGLIQQGRERAFTELYDRYSQPMVRYFHRMLWQDNDKAQDFLQDLFVKIIERPEYFDTTKKFSTWIYSVAHNMCKNEYRKQMYRDAFQAEAQHQVRYLDDTIEKMDHQEFQRALQNAMVSWPEDDRHLFVLRHDLEMTFAEIGETINCPEGTVKSRWFYLRKRIAVQFQEYQTILK